MINQDSVEYKKIDQDNKRRQLRDFGATFMNIEELQQGIRTAIKKARKCKDPEKGLMYGHQAAAYRDRIAWYSEK